MRPRVRVVARSVLRDEHEAEDAVQDAFLRALRCIGSLREPAALRGWLLVLARRAALDRFRKLRPVVHVAEGAPEPPDLREGLPSDAMEVAEAFARLPPWAQRTLDLKASGWTLAEIAAEEGISVAAVKTRLHRARARLRQVLS
jgi:RNA polymerase sigma-70 factor (ECF subfamily)